MKGHLVNTIQDQVRDVLVSTLGIEGRAVDIDTDTPLLDSIPELDSMAVVELMVTIEERFGIMIDDADFSASLLATLGSLSDFVEQRLGDRSR